MKARKVHGMNDCQDTSKGTGYETSGVQTECISSDRMQDIAPEVTEVWRSSSATSTAGESERALQNATDATRWRC